MLPSLSVYALTNLGCINFPSFAIDETAVISWIGVTDIDWPKEIVASSTGPTSFSLYSILLASPVKSIPVLLVRPKASM